MLFEFSIYDIYNIIYIISYRIQYIDYKRYADSTDHDRYCEYSYESTTAPLWMKECYEAQCVNTPSPTFQPTIARNASASNGRHWIVDHIEWFILFLVFVFGVFLVMIWKRHKKRRRPHKPAELQIVPRKPRVSTNDKESLLYGDF